MITEGEKLERHKNRRGKKTIKKKKLTVGVEKARKLRIVNWKKGKGKIGVENKKMK